MNQIIQQLYERGDTEHLMATALGAGDFTDDCTGAREALALLARLGDQDALAFCGVALEACSRAH